MWNSRPVRILWHSFNWLTRVAIICVGTLALIMAFGIIALRYWLLPGIEQYHEKITASLTQAIGRPVTIEKIAGDWQGLNPRLSLVNFSVLDEQKHPALMLPSVKVSVSWLSLLTAELRLANLEIDRPELLIRRNEEGKLFIGSVELQAQKNAGGGSYDFADWLLHQSRMVARNALIVWVDEQRGAKPLILENVDVRIENLLKHHRFAMRAVVPAELASPIDVRGDFHGRSFSDMSTWRGQVFTQLQYANITAWRPWFDLPHEFSRGHGALRGWLDVTAGKVSRLQVDLGVRDVATKLADDVPEMMLRNLQGRATWHALTGGFELETKKLTMQLENGVSLPTTDLYLNILDAQARQPASGEIRANLLQLETLVSLINFVPVPANLRAELDAYAPRGKVENLHAQWQGTPQHLNSFTLSGKFENMALRQVGKMPGFSGLTADINGNQDSGKLHIDSRQLHVDAPDILRESLEFHTLRSNASWQHLDKELLVDVKELAVSNTDVEGKAHGSYRTSPDSRGILDLTVDLSRADMRQVARYTPLIVTKRLLSDWLHDALLAGDSNDFHLRILGNLKDFPFDQSQNDQFEISANFQNGAVRFAKEWPIVEQVKGKFLMRGKRMEISSDDAQSATVSLHNISVELPDITTHKPSLEIKLQGAADTSNFLAYVQHSPIRGYSKGFTDAIQAQGAGALDLAIRIPDLNDARVEVDGVFSILNNEVDLGGRIPVMNKANGELRFTQQGFQTHQMTAEILGGPARIDVKTTPSGGVVGALDGKANLDALRLKHSPPLLAYLHGETAWNAAITSAKNTLAVNIDSTLQGVASTLPVPFNKSKDDTLPLSIAVNSGETTGTSKAETNIAVGLGQLLSARAVQKNQNGVDTLKRATINFGGQEKWPEQDGVWLIGSLPELSVQGWKDVFGKTNEPSAAPANLPGLSGADVRIAKLTGYGYTLKDLHVTANQHGDDVAMQLEGPTVNGEVIWQPHGFQNASKLSAHLKNLYWVTDAATIGNVSNQPDDTPASVLQPGMLPTLEVTIDELQVNGKHLGRAELAGHPETDAWLLQRFMLANPDGSLSGDGVWSGGAGNPRTKVNMALEISSAEKILSRSGFPDTVKDGSGKLTANLAWVGAPEAFNLNTLAGTLKLEAGKGQFLKIDPSVSKLLGVLSVLSLQALPKHITLDFKDVFSEGFQFDSIKGNALIQSGSMTTQDFHIDGSAGKVLMRGNVDLINETQDLHVEFLPSIGSGISLVGVLVINPVVGISAFVVDKILGNPLDKLVSFEYNVTGTWAEPNVSKVGEKSIPVRVKGEEPIDANEPDKVPVPANTNQPIAQ